MSGDAVEQALAGEGPLFAAMLAERARDLAAAGGGVASAEEVLQVLVVRGRSGPWLLPLAEALRVEPLGVVTPLPDRSAAVLGLAVLAGRRWLAVDLDAALGGSAPGPADGPGHAVLLRRQPLALVAVRVDAVMSVTLAEGVMVDPDRVLAAVTPGGTS